MTDVGRAYVQILPSMRGFGPSLSRGVGRSTDTVARSSGHRFGEFYTKSALGPLRALGVAAAGIFAVEKVGEFFKSSIAEARQSQVVAAKTAAVIKSTGGVANVSAKQIGNLATAISNKVGIDDEAIQSSENYLLTFKNVRNEVGKGNDIFNQAAQSVTDMSAAMDQSAKSSAIQLGKALNDPIKGLTALSRVGVTFDAQQVKQIKTLVASGKTMQAQKIILGELTSEFGGAAAASTTTGQKVSVAFSNIKEQVGKGLLPALDALERGLLNGVFPALRQSASYIKSDVVPALTQFGQFVNSTIIPSIVNLAKQIGPSLVSAGREAFGFIQTNVLPVLQQLWTFIATKVVPAVGQLVVTAFASFKSAVHSISSTIQAHRAQLTELFNGIKKVAGFVLSVMVPVFKFELKSSFKVAGVAINWIISVLAQGVIAFNKIKSAAEVAGKFFSGPFVRVIGSLVSIAVKGFKFMADSFFSAAGLIVHSAASAFGWVPKLGGKLKGASAAFDQFQNNVDSKLSSMARTANGWGHDIGLNIGAGLTQGLNASQRSVATAALALSNTAQTHFKMHAQISSPSKVFHGYGVNIVQGLVNGMNAGKRRIDRSLAYITSHITDLPKTVQSWWTQIAKAGQRQSDELGNQLDHLSTKFQATSDAAKQMRQNVSQSLTQNSGLANLDLSTGASISAGFGAQLASIREFTRDLKMLAHKGLSKGVYNQLLAMGPTAGLPIARDLLSQPGQIHAVNKDQAAINRITSKFAQNAADAKYGKTLDNQLSQLKGLRGDIREERKAVLSIGRQVVNAEHKIQRDAKQKARTKTGSGK